MMRLEGKVAIITGAGSIVTDFGFSTLILDMVYGMEDIASS